MSNKNNKSEDNNNVYITGNDEIDSISIVSKVMPEIKSVTKPIEDMAKSLGLPKISLW
jgi:hypothetical protein